MRHATVPIRSSAILTGSYVAGSVIGQDVSSPEIVQTSNRLIIYADFTIGSLTSCEIKVEFSPDGVTWGQETNKSISGAVNTLTLAYHTFTASGVYIIDIDYGSARYIRISAKGTGTATSSLLAIKASIGSVVNA